MMLTTEQVEAILELAKRNYQLAPDGSCGHRLEHASRDILALAETYAVLCTRMEELEEKLVQVRQERNRLTRYHRADCAVLLDDDSDIVLVDYQTCTYGIPINLNENLISAQ